MKENLHFASVPFAESQSMKVQLKHANAHAPSIVVDKSSWEDSPENERKSRAKLIQSALNQEPDNETLQPSNLSKPPLDVDKIPWPMFLQGSLNTHIT